MRNEIDGSILSVKFCQFYMIISFCKKLNPQQVESRYTSNNKMIML